MLALLLVILIDVISFTVILPVLPFFAEKLGASPTQVGLIITLFALGQLISGPIMGRLSDRVGRKPVMLISQAVTTLSLIGVAMAGNLYLVMAARFVTGLGAGNITVAQSYVSDLYHGKDRTKAFGTIGIAFGVGFFIGPGISGVLAHWGDTAPMWAAVLLSFIGLVVNVFLLPQTPPHKTEGAVSSSAWADHSGFFRNLKLRNILLEIFLFNMAFSTFISGFALFAERRFVIQDHPFGAREMGFLYMYLGLLTIFTQSWFLRFLLGRFNERRLASAGFILAASGYALMSLAHEVPLMVLACTGHSFGMGLLRPNLTSMLSHGARQNQQGAVLGVSQSLASIAALLAPLLAGVLIEHGQLNLWAIVCSLFALVGFSLVFVHSDSRSPQH